MIWHVRFSTFAEKDWKNNNRTEAFFDLLELPFLQNSREIIYINPIKLYIFDENKRSLPQIKTSCKC